MRPSSLGFLVKQGWKNMGANRLMTFASVGVLTACLIITGIASLVSVNVGRVVDFLGSRNEVVVYIEEGLDEQAAEELGRQIAALPNVDTVTYVSKADAFDWMQGFLEDYSSLLSGYENVLPASFDVTVEDLSLLQQTAAQIRTLPGVDETVASGELADVMITVKNAVNYGGWALVLILGLVSIIVISNTIRLTVFARRREISIMKYVGATNTFIRMPFFVEGMTVGAISGLLSAGVVCGAYHLVYNYLNSGKNMWIAGLMDSVLTLQQVWPTVVVSFVLFGIVIGGLGSATSVRKHLKV